MKRHVLFILLVGVIASQGATMGQRLKYDLIEQEGLSVTNMTDIFHMTDNVNGGVLKEYGCFQANAWRATIPVAKRPTIEELNAIPEATVDAWVADRRKADEADYDEWSDREKALAKVLFVTLNKVLVLEGKSPKTAAEFKEYLKEQL